MNTRATKLKSASTLMEEISENMSRQLGTPVTLKPTSGGGISGGGGASVGAALDVNTNTKYFIKSSPISSGGGKMLKAEYKGVKVMSDTQTIKVPKPICYGEGGPMNTAYVVFEYLEFCYGGNGYELGVQLAKMHECTSPNGKFGFDIDNTIGATPQPNTWHDTWEEFWIEERLGHMLKLTQNCGYDAKTIEKLKEKTRVLVSEHNPKPSLLHGDLWGGNKGYAKISAPDTEDGPIVVPVIFDPATYYGDREADVAMTSLFGGFGSDFYQGYADTLPLSENFNQREVVYNLYHILNHYVLFGGGYLSQSRSMIERILRFK